MMQRIDSDLGNGNCVTVSGTGDALPWQWQRPYNFGNYYVPYPHTVITAAPTECTGDVHVFPCPHCDKCKCGGATKGKAKK